MSTLQAKILQYKINLMTRVLAGVADAALSGGADLIVQEQKRRAPKDTGDLANSIHKVRKGDLKYKILAGGAATNKDGYDYAIGQEFGNHHSPAQPYFYSGYRAEKRQVRQSIQNAIKNEIKGTLR